MRKLRFFALIVAFASALFAHGNRAQAAEELGTFKLGSLLLEPEYQLFDNNGATYPNGGHNGFAFRQAQLGLEWRFDSAIGAIVRVGTLSQIGKSGTNGPSPTYPNDSNQYGPVEAYGEYVTGFGAIRAGLLPVDFSLSGISNEGALYFERPLVWRERRVPLRDFGVQVFATHNDFYTLATIHNGEADLDQDGRQYLTSTFGWMGPMGLHVGASGNAGRVVRQNTEWRERQVAAFGSFGGFNLNLQAELATGESKSDAQTIQFNTWHVDVAQPFSDTWGVQARFDWLNRDTRSPNQIVQESDAGLYFQNGMATSTVYILARLTVDQQLPNSYWTGFVVWRLMSKSRLARDEFSDSVRSAL